MQAPEKPDIDEHGAPIDGEPQVLKRRLFMQFQAFGEVDDEDIDDMTEAFEDAEVPVVIYADVNDPRGIAVLTWSEDPAHFVGPVREILADSPFDALEHKPHFTMLGRTYSLGYEADLEEWLFNKPIANVTTKGVDWAVWYPLRRTGAFSRLDAGEQRKILMEHGHIGMAFGAADYAKDVRLACHGLDPNDNDFVIGLTGKDLHPLSAIVQTMRKTVQTSQYIEKLGPFFVGHVIYRNQP